MILLHNFQVKFKMTELTDFMQSIADANLKTNYVSLTKNHSTQKQGTQEWFDFERRVPASNCYKVIYGSTRQSKHYIDKCSTETTHKRMYAPTMQHGTQHINGCNIFQKVVNA